MGIKYLKLEIMNSRGAEYLMEHNSQISPQWNTSKRNYEEQSSINNQETQETCGILDTGRR